MRAIRSRQMFNESDTLVQPASIAFGSLRPSQFISDLAAGRDGLDIVVVGDSNTGSALSDMWGYHHGLQLAKPGQRRDWFRKIAERDSRGALLGANELGTTRLNSAADAWFRAKASLDLARFVAQNAVV